MNATIAIPVAGEQIFEHFGKAETFKLYQIENDRVLSSQTLTPGVAGHEDLALWLVTKGVNAVICDTIGPGALGALSPAGIVALAGVSATADEAVEKLLSGTLEVVTGHANCTHHAGHCAGHCGGACSGHCCC